MVTSNVEQDNWIPFKQTGNDLFKESKYDGAIENYSKALDLCPGKEDKCILYRNRAACYLKLQKFQEAHNDANLVIEEHPSDVKALFRRYSKKILAFAEKSCKILC